MRREGKTRRREAGGETGVCRDQCMVHTDVSSRRQGCREEKARVSGGERGGEEGRVYDREETGAEWMRQGFCLGKRTRREEE